MVGSRAHQELGKLDCPFRVELQATRGPPQEKGGRGPTGRCLVTRFHKSQGHGLTTQHNRGRLGGGRTEGALSQGPVVPVLALALAGWEAWALPSGVDPPEEAGWGTEPAPSVTAAFSQSPLTSFANIVLSPPHAT